MLKMLKEHYQRDTKNLLCLDGFLGDWKSWKPIIQKIKKIIFKEIKKIWHSVKDLSTWTLLNS